MDWENQAPIGTSLSDHVPQDERLVVLSYWNLEASMHGWLKCLGELWSAVLIVQSCQLNTTNTTPSFNIRGSIYFDDCMKGVAER